MPSKSDLEILQHNANVRGQQIANERAEFKKLADAKIAEAVAGLKAAVAADKKLGLDETVRLRDVRPVRPHILDEHLPWDATPATVEKFNAAQAKARADYYEHLVVAAPNLLSPEQFKELPHAVAFCDSQVKAAEIAAEGNQ